MLSKRKCSEIELVFEEFSLIPKTILGKHTKGSPINPIDFDGLDCVKYIETWIQATCQNTKKPKQITEEVWWGENFTAHIQNLGKVIGKKYYDADKKLLACYRIDWDPTKQKHYNINICDENNEFFGKYVLQFGNPANITNRREIDEAMLYTTIVALRNYTPIPYGVASTFCDAVSKNHPDIEKYFNSLTENIKKELFDAMHEAKSKGTPTIVNTTVVTTITGMTDQPIIITTNSTTTMLNRFETHESIMSNSGPSKYQIRKQRQKEKKAREQSGCCPCLSNFYEKAKYLTTFFQRNQIDDNAIKKTLESEPSTRPSSHKMKKD